MPRRRSLAAHAMLFAWLGAAPASADDAAADGPLALNWVRLPGAESCIGPAELSEKVERRVGRRVFAANNTALIVIEGYAAARPSGFELELRVGDAHGNVYGSRTLALDGPDCRQLDDTAALVIALTLRAKPGGAGIVLPEAVAAQLDALFGQEAPGPAADSVPRQAPAVLAPPAGAARTDSAIDARATPADARELALGAGAGFGIAGLRCTSCSERAAWADSRCQPGSVCPRANRSPAREAARAPRCVSRTSASRPRCACPS